MVVLWGTTRKSSSWKIQEILVKPATVFSGSVFLRVTVWSAKMAVDLALSYVMSLQGHTARREHKVSVGSRGISGSMVREFRGGLNDQVWAEDERNPVDCKIKTKTKLRSTTDTEAILIVESPQLIVNKCTQKASL